MERLGRCGVEPQDLKLREGGRAVACAEQQVPLAQQGVADSRQRSAGQIESELGAARFERERPRPWREGEAGEHVSGARQVSGAGPEQHVVAVGVVGLGSGTKLDDRLAGLELDSA